MLFRSLTHTHAHTHTQTHTHNEQREREKSFILNTKKCHLLLNTFQILRYKYPCGGFTSFSGFHVSSHHSLLFDNTSSFYWLMNKTNRRDPHKGMRCGLRKDIDYVLCVCVYLCAWVSVCLSVSGLVCVSGCVHVCACVCIILCVWVRVCVWLDRKSVV